MKKRLWASILASALALSFINMTAYAEDTSELSMHDLTAIAEECATISGDYKVYESFTVNNQEIRLFSEPTMTADDAIIFYANAYELVAAAATDRGISTSMDDPEFQSFAKIYAAMFEDGNEDLVSECKAFCVYMDYYENIAQNEEILKAASSSFARTTEEVDLQSMMPTDIQSTVASGENTSMNEVVAVSSGYNTSAVVTYANTWWDKTNNEDYPYYADYFNLSTSTNAYNDLDSGRAGQSSTRRSWSDCADFVSQCLAAGGVPQIKNGVILPSQKTENWYYNDSKPSHTWGGANNFFQHWKDRAGVAGSSSDLGVGDAISIDFGGDGSPDHTVIIVQAGNTDSTKYLASHTVDRYKFIYSNGSLSNFTLAYLYNNNWTIYGYEIDSIF